MYEQHLIWCAQNATISISNLTDFKIFQPDPSSPLKKGAGCPLVKHSPIFQQQEPLATEVIENACVQLPVIYPGQPIKNLYCEPYEQNDLSYIHSQNSFYEYISLHNHWSRVTYSVNNKKTSDLHNYKFLSPSSDGPIVEIPP